MLIPCRPQSQRGSSRAHRAEQALGQHRLPVRGSPAQPSVRGFLGPVVLGGLLDCFGDKAATADVTEVSLGFRDLSPATAGLGLCSAFAF